MKKNGKTFVRLKTLRTFATANEKQRLQKQVGAIAQLVEQRTENPCVPGSIPGGTTFRKRYRNVAQLVAHYVRDVGVGRSSRLIPTEKVSDYSLTFFFIASAGPVSNVPDDRTAVLRCCHADACRFLRNNGRRSKKHRLPFSSRRDPGKAENGFPIPP